MNLSTLQQQIIDRYFGESFTKQQTLIDKIVAKSDFKHLSSVLESLPREEIDQIFRLCNSKDVLSSKFVDKECRMTFMKLRSVSIETDFV